MLLYLVGQKRFTGPLTAAGIVRMNGVSMNRRKQLPMNSPLIMALKGLAVTVVCLVFLFMVQAAEARSSATDTTSSFYQGKAIRIIVGQPPGNSFDLIGRLVARHLGKHIPGNPAVFIQNMPGGGGLLAPNYVFNAAKPDGLTIAISNSAIVMDQITGNKAVQFDFSRFSWIGSASQEIRLAFMRKDTPYHSVEAIRTAAKPPKIGYSGTGSGFYQMSRLVENCLGLKLDLIPGFIGSAPIDLAIERGDLDGMFGTPPASMWRAWGDQLKRGAIIVILQTGIWDTGSQTFKRHPDFQNVPTLWELASAQKKNIIKVALVPISPIRMFYAPPGLPAVRLKILRDAFWATMNDAAYRAEVIKVLGSPQEKLYPVPGEKLHTMMQDSKKIPPDLVEELKTVYGG